MNKTYENSKIKVNIIRIVLGIIQIMVSVYLIIYININVDPYLASLNLSSTGSSPTPADISQYREMVLPRLILYAILSIICLIQTKKLRTLFYPITMYTFSMLLMHSLMALVGKSFLLNLLILFILYPATAFIGTTLAFVAGFLIDIKSYKQNKKILEESKQNDDI